jgi:hypothetical protein
MRRFAYLWSTSVVYEAIRIPLVDADPCTSFGRNRLDRCSSLAYDGPGVFDGHLHRLRGIVAFPVCVCVCGVFVD